ncbi:unnamed protein product [Paramecium sonneborni]|uniref:Myb-like DNA-binding domain protein n=1 Tax=Paramecium sonneborni TaxID=65129 RepID=A0A8S1NH15_9CILI|nr:unnamed protein product [Paramecium sonneborni]
MSEQHIQKDQLKRRNKSIIKKAWNNFEDRQLKTAIRLCGMNWIQIASYVHDRNPNQCAQRWKRLKGKRSRTNQFWKKSEDEQLMYLVQQFGKKWSKIAQIIQFRNSKQCRDRYINVLDPDLKTESFSQEEDQIIYEQYLRFGSKWSYISKQLEGRSQNQVKNRFYSHIRSNYLQIQNPYYLKQTSLVSQQILQETREEHLRKMEYLQKKIIILDQSPSDNQDSFNFQYVPNYFYQNMNLEDPSMMLEDQF